MDTERMPLLARPPAPLSNLNSPALTTATTTTTTAASSVSPLSYGSSSSPTHHVHSTSIDVDYSSDYMTLVSASVLPTPAHGYGTPGSVESSSGHHASTTASGKSVYDFANAGGLHPIRHTFLDDYLPFVHNKPFTHGIEHNITAGITVSLINIPLSIALAVASGSTPVCGVIAAVWGGLAASIFGGSQFNITGPTGALSGMLARYVLIFGLGALPFVSMLSGAFMLLVFAMNWDKYVTYLPSSVAHGFTLGVAVILASSQINSICSLPPLPPHEHSILNLYESLTHLHLANPVSVIVFLVLWLTLFSLVQRWPKVPWSVAIAAVSIVIGYLSSVDVLPPLITLREKYGTLEAVLALPLDVSRVNEWAWTDFVSASMSVAFVAVLESLISGKIADGLTKTTMNQRQETFGVAIANVLSGSLGGIPVTAALARTALNIRSGANNRISGVVCSISSLCIAYFLMPLFSYMPLCAISAMLVQVAVGMVESKHLRKAFSIDRGAFYLTIVVALLCVILDPTMAIVVGAVGGLLRFAQQSAMGYGEMTLTTDLHVGTKLDLSTVDEAVQHAHHSEHASGSAGGAVSGGAGAPAPHPPAQSFLQSIRESMFGPSELERQTRSIEHKLVSHDMMHHVEHHTVIYRVIGDLTYISAISHSQRLKHLENCDNVILSLRYCYFVDLDGLDSLEESISELRMRKKRVLLCGISPLTRPLFKRLDWYLRLEAKGWTFNLVEEAVAYIAGKQSQLNHPYLVQGSSPRSAAALHPDRRVLVDRLLPGGEVHSPAVLSAGGGTAAEASSARSSSARAPSKRDASPASASAATSRR